MDDLSLTETESRYFGDLFLCCDVDKTGKIPVLKATELFRSANLSNDVIRQITLLSGIPQTALYITRVQFYSCLKLIAAYQASIPLRLEVLSSSTINLPLPRFSWKDSPPLNRPNIVAGVIGSGSNAIIMSNSIVSSSASGNMMTTNETNGLISTVTSTASGLNVNPSLHHGNVGSVGSGGGVVGSVGETITSSRQWREARSPDLIELSNNTEISQDISNSDLQSTDSEVEQNEANIGRVNRRNIGGSPEAWSTNSDSPTPTNSVAERSWVKDNLWQGILGDEHRQLLGTEEESSDKHSSDDDNETDLESLYQITPEQREYYHKQFKAVQPDPNGLLSGHIARVFFEKSRIPIEELRHIWQLCDVTRDGALSLAEFTAAMHLVVLRRNNIPLPQVLPSCLHPTVLNQITVSNKQHMKVSSSPVVVSGQSKNRSISNSPPSAIEATTTPPNLRGKELKDLAKDWTNQNREWTKFTESPTSNVSSPGPKPVNFDMQRTAQAVVSDPQILHPVPLRVTPVGTETVEDDHTNRTQKRTENLVYDNTTGILRENESSPKQQQQSNSHHQQQLHRESLQGNDLRAIQRPQPKKLPAKSIGAIPPPPQRESSFGSGSNDTMTTTTTTTTVIAEQLPSGSTNMLLLNKKEPPPLPPPRPHRHARSSSLDLNKLKMGGTPSQSEITTQNSFEVQMDSNNSGFADFTHFPADTAAKSISSEQQIATSYIGNVDYNVSSNVSQSAVTAVRPTIPSQRVSAFEVYRKPNVTPRSSQSPDIGIVQQQQPLQSQLQVVPSSTTAVIPPSTNSSSTVSLTSGNEYEKRVMAISDTLRHVSFKQEKNFSDVLRHLKEQNILLLRVCNDLSEELLTVQQKKEEVRIKLEAATNVCSDENVSNLIVGGISGSSGGIHSNV